MRACDSGFDVCSSELGRARRAFAFEVDEGDLAAGARAAGKAARQAAGRRLHALLDQRVPGAAALAAPGPLGRDGAAVLADVVRAGLGHGQRSALWRRRAMPYAHLPWIVILGLDPSIQGNRSVTCPWTLGSRPDRSEEHTSELQSLMRISYAVFCLKKKKTKQRQ